MSNLYDLKKREGKNLILWAWRLEIAFVSMGLLAAISISSAGVFADREISELTFNEWNSVILGSMIWIAVALTELLKIPVTKGIYLIKGTFLRFLAFIFLVIICLATFESITTGLDRSFSLREQQINSYRQQIKKIEFQLNKIDEIKYSQFAVTEEMLIEKSNVELQRKLEIVNEEIALLKTLLKEFELNNNPELQQLKTEQINLNNTIQELYTQRENLEKLLLDNLRINSTQQNIELSNSIFRKKEIRDYFADERKLLQDKHDEGIKEIKEKIQKSELLRDEISSNILKLSKLSPQTVKQKKSYENKIEALVLQRSSLIEENKQDLTDRLAKHKQNNNLLEEYEYEQRLLKEERNNLISRINENGTDFLFSISKRIYGADSVFELSSKQTSLVAMVIITTLGSVVALAGPILTAVAMKLTDINNKKHHKISRAIRLLLLSLRRRLNKPKIVEKIVEKPVDVIKEVPVEKVVKEIVEVPKPIEIVKYIGVPVPKIPEELPTHQTISDFKWHKEKVVENE